MVDTSCSDALLDPSVLATEAIDIKNDFQSSPILQ